MLINVWLNSRYKAHENNGHHDVWKSIMRFVCLFQTVHSSSLLRNKFGEQLGNHF